MLREQNVKFPRPHPPSKILIFAPEVVLDHLKNRDQLQFSIKNTTIYIIVCPCGRRQQKINTRL